MRRGPYRIEIFFTPGCCCAGAALRQLRKLMAEEGIERPVAVHIVGPTYRPGQRRFEGSPIVVVDGKDIAGSGGCGLHCRPGSPCRGTPSDEATRNALHRPPAA
jgi:hypothetical protein